MNTRFLAATSVAALTLAASSFLTEPAEAFARKGRDSPRAGGFSAAGASTSPHRERLKPAFPGLVEE